MSELLRIEHLTKTFPLQGRTATAERLWALDDVSLSLNSGEFFCLVGESGSGKSTLARILLGLMAPDSGSIFYQGRDIAHLPLPQRGALRREFQMVFQNPQGSLNPSLSLYSTLAEAVHLHAPSLKKPAIRGRVDELLERVGLSRQLLPQRPAQLSGGQRQRVNIARALASTPALLIADEPVSALDVSVQAQIMNLLKSLQQEAQLTCLFISHDMAVVQHLADRVGVLRQGELVEVGQADELFAAPNHPYTQTLLQSVLAL